MGLVLVITVCTVTAALVQGRTESVKDYSRLIELIELEEKEAPFFVFNNFEDAFDVESHKASLEYFKENPDIVRKIQRDLDGGAVQWEVRDFSYRLLFVPEKREEYARLFESYCHNVIKDILDKTGLRNPYSSIQTLFRELPEISHKNDGISAFLVHNLAKEYIARYVFSNPQQKKALIGLRGTVFSGEIGSFSSYLQIHKDGTLEFIRDRYTIWQDSAHNPYTALMTPVEETFHIALREYTESAIAEDIALDFVPNTESVHQIVDDWISVEEAIVGGLVHAMLPDLFKEYRAPVPDAWIKADIETKTGFKKYRFLKKGIRVVEHMGYKESLKLYQSDPRAFKGLLI